jgi:hypothetical protein
MPAIKPTNSKAYGSIPHLPGSYVSKGDKYIHEGQARILTGKTRDSKDTIIIQEKLDGSCVAVVRQGDKLIPIQRKGYPCDSSPHRQHHMFARWVAHRKDRFMSLIADGERVVGEWIAMAHGTQYTLHGTAQPFAVFDIFDKDNNRALCGDVSDRVFNSRLQEVSFLCYGPADPEIAYSYLKTSRGIGSNISSALPEGLVYRCERNGKVDFLAKYVRPDYVPGLYFSDDPSKQIWNWIE